MPTKPAKPSRESVLEAQLDEIYAVLEVGPPKRAGSKYGTTHEQFVKLLKDLDVSRMPLTAIRNELGVDSADDAELLDKIRTLNEHHAVAEEELAEIRKLVGLKAGVAHEALVREIVALRDVGPKNADAMGLRGQGDTAEERERPILAWLLGTGKLDELIQPHEETTVGLLTRLFTFGNGSVARGSLQVAAHLNEVFRWAALAGEFNTCDGVGEDAWTGAMWFLEQYLEVARTLDWRIERAEQLRRNGAV